MMIKNDPKHLAVVAIGISCNAASMPQAPLYYNLIKTFRLDSKMKNFALFQCIFTSIVLL